MDKREVNFLRLLCFEGNKQGKIALSPGRNIFKYLAGRAMTNPKEIQHSIEIFETRKFLTLDRDKKGKAVAVKMNISPEDIDYIASEGEKIFAVFIDYLNIERGITDPAERRSRMKDFSWLLNPILEKGKIAFIYIFIPDATVPEFSPIHVASKQRIPIITCPRKIIGGIMKDVDTVDQFLSDVATNHIYHSNVTDIIIVSGDADFSPVVRRALLNRKRVTVVSAICALSGRFLDMEVNEEIEIIRI